MIFNNPELLLHSPWWEEGFTMDADVKLRRLTAMKFVYCHPLLDEYPFSQDAILVLRGPRQIGKSTLIKQIISKLLTNRIPGKSILYLPCDRIVDFNQLYSIILEYIQIRRIDESGRLYFFIDEIPYVPQWQRAIKSLADTGLLEGTTVLVTGSNAIDLKFSAERLPGRTGGYYRFEKQFLPLTFKEFYKLVNPQWDGSYKPSQAYLYKKYFHDYLITGGFPAVINEYYTEWFISPSTYETYINWIEGDIHKLGRSVEIMYGIVKSIDRLAGSRASYTQIAKETGVASQQTVQEYLEILRDLFITFECPYLSLEQKRSNYKKNRKFYFTDPFIHNTLIVKERGFMDNGHMYVVKKLLQEKHIDYRLEETVGCNMYKKFDKMYYGDFSGGKEIDFVGVKAGETKLFEVKNSKEIDLSRYKSIPAEYDNITIISQGIEQVKGRFHIEPALKFFLQVDKHCSLHQTQQYQRKHS